MRRRRSLGGGFSPRKLFADGTVGAWYDPSDYSTLFQDSAGTTPVTAVEQPVGLMLDKSQGLVLGSEATSGAWLNGYTTTFDTFTSTGPSSFTATTTGAKSPRVAVLANLPTAGWYWIEFTATFTGGSVSAVGVANTGSPYSTSVISTATPTSGLIFRTLIYTSAAREYLTVIFNATSASTLSVTGVSVKSYAGNHASQSTSTSRPVLRARYNLFTYSEDFTTSWNPTRLTTANTSATTDPLGGLTADKINPNGNVNSDSYNLQYFNSISGTVYTTSVYFKDAGLGWAVIFFGTSTNAIAFFNLATGVAGSVSGSATGKSSSITSVGNGWYRCTLTCTANTTGSVPVGFAPAEADNDIIFATGTTNGVYIWGAQLVTGSSAGTYQRIAAATDYATAGFLPYLAGDGVDDQMSSGNINLTGTDKLTAVFGSFTNSTANQGVFQFGASGAGTMNALYMAGATTDMRSSLQGSTGTSQMRITGTGLGVAAVYSELYNIAGATAADESQIRLNGTLPTQTVQSAGPAGGGNFANTALSILQFGSVFFLNGRLYGLVFCGKTLSASELSATEAWMNSKTGAY